MKRLLTRGEPELTLNNAFNALCVRKVHTLYIVGPYHGKMF